MAKKTVTVEKDTENSVENTETVVETENLKEKEEQQNEKAAEDKTTETAILSAGNETEPEDEEVDDVEEDGKPVEEKEIDLNELYKKRQYIPASQEVRKELYENERVVSQDGKHRAKTEKDFRKDEFDLLVHAIGSNGKRILSGIIDGIGTDEALHKYVTVSLDDSKGFFQIRIYVSELCEIDEKSLMDKGAIEGAKRLENMLKSRIGSHVRFTLYKLDEPNLVAYGNRIEAMSLDAKRFYRKLQSDGVPDICEGTIVEAEIVSARQDRVVVYACGAETTIRSAELSHLAIPSVSEEFHNRDTINVKVSNITFGTYEANGRKYTMVHVDASKKAATPKPSELYYNQFNIGDVCKGVITHKAEKSVFVRLKDKIDCICPMPSIGRAEIGKECVVVIDRKKDEEKFIYGIISQIR